MTIKQIPYIHYLTNDGDPDYNYLTLVSESEDDDQSGAFYVPFDVNNYSFFDEYQIDYCYYYGNGESSNIKTAIAKRVNNSLILNIDEAKIEFVREEMDFYDYVGSAEHHDYKYSFVLVHALGTDEALSKYKICLIGRDVFDRQRD